LKNYDTERPKQKIARFQINLVLCARPTKIVHFLQVEIFDQQSLDVHTGSSNRVANGYAS
jgi:hypothetical protein